MELNITELTWYVYALSKGANHSGNGISYSVDNINGVQTIIINYPDGTTVKEVNLVESFNIYTYKLLQIAISWPEMKGIIIHPDEVAIIKSFYDRMEGSLEYVPDPDWFSLV